MSILLLICINKKFHIFHFVQWWKCPGPLYIQPFNNIPSLIRLLSTRLTNTGMSSQSPHYRPTGLRTSVSVQIKKKKEHLYFRPNYFIKLLTACFMTHLKFTLHMLKSMFTFHGRPGSNPRGTHIFWIDQNTHYYMPDAWS